MFRAELLALVSTTATKVTAAVAVLGLVLTQVVLVTLLPALARGDIGPGAEALGPDLPTLDLASAGSQLAALSPLGASLGGGSIGIALIAITLLGALAGTSDDRYGGMVGAVLASPRRMRVVAAKTGAVAVAGVAIGVVMAVVSLGTLLVGLAVTGTPLAASAGDVVGVLARGALTVGCLALLGLGVGIIARSQLAGVLAVLAILIAEPVIVGTSQLVTGGAAPAWTQFLPVALAQEVIGGGSSAAPAVGIVGAGGTLIAIAALLALTFATLAAASAALSRRDI